MKSERDTSGSKCRALHSLNINITVNINVSISVNINISIHLSLSISLSISTSQYIYHCQYHCQYQHLNTSMTVISYLQSLLVCLSSLPPQSDQHIEGLHTASLHIHQITCYFLDISDNRLYVLRVLYYQLTLLWGQR